jgi:hypothetical protein
MDGAAHTSVLIGRKVTPSMTVAPSGKISATIIRPYPSLICWRYDIGLLSFALTVVTSTRISNASMISALAIK